MILYQKVLVAFASRLSGGRTYSSRIATVCRSSVSVLSQRCRLVSLIKTHNKNYIKSLSSETRITDAVIDAPPAVRLQAPDSEAAANTCNSIIRNMKTEDRPTEKSNVREAYPEIEPFDSGFLQVSDLHHIYYEQSGKAGGKPVLFLHGGPGGGCSGSDRCYFDPNVYRIILVDQRGAGKSLPAAELKENTTWDVVDDIEKLRTHLRIEKWVVFGGSWGACLSLTYAETYPDRVKALILRGIFTLRRKELVWYYQQGASFIFPDAWEKYVEPIPLLERDDMMGAYYRRLTGDDEAKRLQCAQRWSQWEMSTSRLFVDENLLKRAESDQWALQFARIECHYFVNGGFFDHDGQLLDNVDKIRHIPCTIVQGRYDVVCPMDTAWALHKRWPEAEFNIVHDAGHSAKEQGTTSLLVRAADKYATL